MFGGGFVGVDVFFVISGYLITTIIVAELEQGTFSIVNFYERRARRILPALFLVMLVCIPFAWFWLLPSDMKDFSKSLVAVSVFASNILFWRASGYFDTASELKPLIHTWSLAVEEQYYVLFPLFLMLAWRLGKRWIWMLLAAIFVVSLAVAQWASLAEPSAAFFLLPTRGWELLMGAFAAFYLSKANRVDVNRNVAEIAGWLGLALIFYSVFAYNKTTPFPGLYALAPTVGTGLIILFATQQTAVGKFIGNKAFVGIGLISYSAYLWHQPLFAFARHKNLGEPSDLAYLCLSFTALVLAYFSWRYVEKPFRKKGGISRKSIFVFSALFSSFFVLLGLYGWSKDGFSDYYEKFRLSDLQRSNIQLIKTHTSYDLHDAMADDGDCHFWSENIDTRLKDRFKSCSLKYGKALLVVGDSHAMNIYNIITKSNARKFIVGIVQAGCRPHKNEKFCQYDDVLKFSKNNGRSISRLIFHQSGDYLLASQGAVLNEDVRKENHLIFHDENIQKIRAYLDMLSNYVEVIWLGPFVESRVDYRNLKKFDHGFAIEQKYIDLYKELNRQIYDLHKSSRDRSYEYIPFEDVVTINPDFLKIGECLTFRDGDHFSRCGEDIIAERLHKNKTIRDKLNKF